MAEPRLSVNPVFGAPESQTLSSQLQKRANMRGTQGCMSQGTQLCDTGLIRGKNVLSHFSRARLFMKPWTIALQAPLSVGVLQARLLE